MTFMLACASHSPVMNSPGAAPRDIEDEVAAVYAGLAAKIAEFDPEIVIQFAPDHASTFALRAMPPACVGLRASSLGDYDLPTGRVRTDPAVGEACVAYLHGAGVDVAGSYDMQLDHGFTQLLHILFGSYERRVVLPIFVNCASMFRMPPHRVLALGRAVGHFAKTLDRRVLFLGSGGLSHDPPTPSVTEDMSPAIRTRLVDGLTWTPTMLKERTQMVFGAIREYAEGRSSLQKLNPAWDRGFLGRVEKGEVEALASLTDAEILREAGRGGGEVRNWIAALGAMEAATGSASAHVDYNRPIDHWMTGMAIAHRVS